MTAQHVASVVLAQAPQPADPGGQGEDFGKSSPVGLLLLILFGIAVALLVWSMSKHLKKLPTTFDAKRADAAAPRRAKRAESEAESESESTQTAEDAEAADDSKSANGTAATG